MTSLAVTPERHRENTAVLGMVLFVASWAMLFAALFFAYGFTRVRAVAWPPLDLPQPPIAAGAIATLAIAAASAALVIAGRRRTARSNLGATLAAIAGSLLFLVVQIAVWQALFAAGLRPDGGPYPSVFYGLTTFHALHVAVGIVGLATLVPRLARGGDGVPLGLRLWTIYVHMVGVLWALIYLGVYLL